MDTTVKDGRFQRGEGGQARRASLEGRINSRLNVVVLSPTPFGVDRNGCWPSQGSQLPRALPWSFCRSEFQRQNQNGETSKNYKKLHNSKSAATAFGKQNWYSRT